jgi:hypothetical protein
MNLTKKTKILFNESYKPLKKEIKEDIRSSTIHTFFLAAHGTFSKTCHTLQHKASLCK